LRPRLFRHHEDIRIVGRDLFEDGRIKSAAIRVYRGIGVEESDPPAFGGIGDLALKLTDDFGVGAERDLAGGVSCAQGKLLRPDTYTQPESGRSHDGEVSVVQLLADVRRSCVGDGALHLRRDSSDLIG
jgi:hypothetical protein